MNIVVSYKKSYGKELFYPVSDDAKFITKFTGRPTLLKSQLKLAKEKGWNVEVVQEKFDVEKHLQ